MGKKGKNKKGQNLNNKQTENSVILETQTLKEEELKSSSQQDQLQKETTNIYPMENKQDKTETDQESNVDYKILKTIQVSSMLKIDSQVVRNKISNQEKTKNHSISNEEIKDENDRIGQKKQNIDNEHSQTKNENNLSQDINCYYKVVGKFQVLLEGWLEVSVNMGDITDEKVDAITNAANEYLQHGGGVAGAISKKGGPKIQQESNEWVRDHGRVETGTAGAVTSAGRMKNCQYVIHAVGPVWTYALDQASKLECESISVPAISSGIFGFPRNLCAQILFDAAEEFCYQNQQDSTSLRYVRFTNFDKPTVDVFQKEFQYRYKSQVPIQKQKKSDQNDPLSIIMRKPPNESETNQMELSNEEDQCQQNQSETSKIETKDNIPILHNSAQDKQEELSSNKIDIHGYKSLDQFHKVEQISEQSQPNNQQNQNEEQLKNSLPLSQPDLDDIQAQSIQIAEKDNDKMIINIGKGQNSQKQNINDGTLFQNTIQKQVHLNQGQTVNIKYVPKGSHQEEELEKQNKKYQNNFEDNRVSTKPHYHQNFYNEIPNDHNRIHQGIGNLQDSHRSKIHERDYNHQFSYGSQEYKYEFRVKDTTLKSIQDQETVFNNQQQQKTVLLKPQSQDDKSIKNKESNEIGCLKEKGTSIEKIGENISKLSNPKQTQPANLEKESPKKKAKSKQVPKFELDGWKGLEPQHFN
ncbi:UNKNOWN [Stylonychia lemnae]|uniref:Macro domain-containing protein n=1 Tax=Stylonychia lemnae TaxID=5949 RepID=A0A078A052_STYLE|nr:UNKNOWN [Stylonychia lemnae]|eukprot:CDW75525.1 UNKNOWN [Stylonychia lemnae]